MSAKKMMQDEFEIDQIEENGELALVADAKPSKNGKVQPGQPFDPTQYLSNFDGRDYLEVKWRLLWLRSQHPDARITTEIVQHNEEGGFALFRAEVDIPDGGKATGWGSETVRDFHDYIEAAETKAIGRALAALGYGTQFCTDFDFSANARPGTAQIVDAPVNLSDPRTTSTRNGGFVQKAISFANGSNANSGGGGSSKSGSFGNSGFIRV